MFYSAVPVVGARLSSSAAVKDGAAAAAAQLPVASCRRRPREGLWCGAGAVVVAYAGHAVRTVCSGTGWYVTVQQKGLC